MTINIYPWLTPADGKKDLIAQAQSLMQEVAEEMIAATKTSQGTDDELDPIWMIYEGTDVSLTSSPSLQGPPWPNMD